MSAFARCRSSLERVVQLWAYSEPRPGGCHYLGFSCDTPYRCLNVHSTPPSSQACRGRPLSDSVRSPVAHRSSTSGRWAWDTGSSHVRLRSMVFAGDRLSATNRVVLSFAMVARSSRWRSLMPAISPSKLEIAEVGRCVGVGRGGVLRWSGSRWPCLRPVS